MSWKSPSIEYLLIGHVAMDITPEGLVLGGTAAYSGLTAAALGCDVYVVTSCSEDVNLDPLLDTHLLCIPSDHTTTFENINTAYGRVQQLHSKAEDIRAGAVPTEWSSPDISHLAPICQEVDPKLVHTFTGTFIGITPQGWLRKWDSTGKITHSDIDVLLDVIPHASAVVLSIEDLGHDEEKVKLVASQCPVLVITRSDQGASIFWNGKRLDIQASNVDYVDDTGAGDIFATAFFVYFQHTKNPWEAGRFASFVAATSVTRKGISGTPSSEEIQGIRVGDHQ